MWLLQKMTPDHSTISEFRKTNTKAFKAVFKRFNVLCLECELFSRELVAIDGTFIKAVGTRVYENEAEKTNRAGGKALGKWMEMLDTTDPGNALDNGGACRGCPLLEKCTKKQVSEASISAHQGAIDANLARLASNSDAYRRRGALVEHSFGTIKAAGCGE